MRRMYDSLSETIQPDQRSRLSLYRDAKFFSPNIEFMDNLLNFIEHRYHLLPRQSPSRQICFRPQFTAFVSANKTYGGLHVSLFGVSFRAGKVQRAKFPNWRKFVVSHRDHLRTARDLIVEAFDHRMEANDSGRWTYEEELKGLAEYFL